MESMHAGLQMMLDRGELLKALRQFRRGDFTVRMPLNLTGVDGEIAQAFNDVVELEEAKAAEIARVAELVGKEGQFGHRMSLPGATGAWAEVIDSRTSPHAPVAPGTLMRARNWPSLPTSSATRPISAALASSSSTTSLNACAISPSTPVRLSGMRTEKSPRRNWRSALSSSPRSSIICRPAWIDSMGLPSG